MRTSALTRKYPILDHHSLALLVLAARSSKENLLDNSTNRAQTIARDLCGLVDYGKQLGVLSKGIADISFEWIPPIISEQMASLPYAPIDVFKMRMHKDQQVLTL